MHNRKRHLTYAFGIFVMGAALVLISSVGAQTTDAIDDPVRQPHLKSWSNVIPNADRRFIVLADFNNAAVLDRETGLVWETSPDPGFHTWGVSQETFSRNSAPWYCAQKRVGGRSGWRLPSFPELASLIDPSVLFPGPTLPPGHPLSNVQSDAAYWSATRIAIAEPLAYVVNFDGGDVNTAGLAHTLHAWCVRGGMNADQY